MSERLSPSAVSGRIASGGGPPSEGKRAAIAHSLDDAARPAKPERARGRIRVLFLGRLFAGLKQCLAEERWAPQGVPAIYRLLEGLHVDPEVDLVNVFCAKEPDPRFAKRRRMVLPEVGETIVLPFRGGSAGRVPKIDAALTELSQTAAIVRLAARLRPDVVYATYANLPAAAFLARAGHRGVVLRFMGVVPHHREVAEGRRPAFAWQLRSPFAHVVCTEDGSDPAVLLPRLLGPRVPWTVRLNGCDAAPMTEAERQSFRAREGLGARPLVLFVGRLEQYKGCREFAAAALSVLSRMPDAACFLVVGDGPLMDEIAADVRAAGCGDRFRFAGAMPHAAVERCVAAADIYVSTNMYGSLSNANLEALATGACLLLPTSNRAIPMDTVTDALIPPEVAKRYDRDRLPGALADALCELLADPQEVLLRRRRTAELAQRLIKPWARSVAEDIALLKSLVRRPLRPGGQ